VIGFIILSSLLIEFTQYFFHRTPDLADIRRNLIGGTIGFLIIHRSSFTNKILTTLFAIMLSFMVIFEGYLVARAVIDDINSKLNFPVLSDFESGLEIDRWEGRATFQISDSAARKGKNSLQVIFKKFKFSDISLVNFPRDWRGYKNLIYYVYSPEKDSFILHMRIYDIKYNRRDISERDDRYNGQFMIRSGWNEIILPMEDIRTAPLSRQLDLSSLTRIRFFTEYLPKDRKVYLDYILLK
jgi:hypothetical protein